MNIHGKDIKIFTANANPKVAREIAEALGLPLGRSTVTSFADGEISVSIEETVRGSDVFVVQSTCGPVNNNLMELLIMVDAFKRASAGRITAVIPSGSFKVPSGLLLSTKIPIKLAKPMPNMVRVRPVTFWFAMKVTVSTA